MKSLPWNGRPDSHGGPGVTFRYPAPDDFENVDPVITVDGTNGGGQVLRTALGLSTVTDTPFRIENVRGGRPDSGLKPQHFAAVRLVTELYDADVAGAELDSGSLSFRPGSARRTQLRADVGTVRRSGRPPDSAPGAD